MYAPSMTASPFPTNPRALLAASVLTVLTSAAWTMDTSTAEQLLKQNGCTKCHAVEKKKDGPAYRDVAAKYKGVADADDKLMHHLTSGDKVKFPDGHEEAHKKLKPEALPEAKGLIAWIRSLEGGTKY